MRSTYPLVPVISILSGVLPLLPLPWLIAHWNTGAWMYALWVSLGCFIHGINEIIWKDHANNVAPIWCDISTRFIVGKSVAIPAASLAITRRIYMMFSLKCPLLGSCAEKRRSVLFDLGLTLGLPIIQMAVYYVVQGQRFNVLEEFGCLPAVVNAWPSFLLVYSWPLMIGSISCIYCSKIVRIYIQRRRNINDMDVSTGFGRYYRALVLGCVDAVFTVPISAFLFVQNGLLRSSVRPYSWVDAHKNFDPKMFSSEEWNDQSHWRRFGPYWNAWATIICALIFFCFFGLTEEVREGYKKVFVAIVRMIGLRRYARSDIPPNEPLDISQFRAASIERTPSTGVRCSFCSSAVLPDSTFRPDSLGRIESDQTGDTLRGMEYELPPIKRVTPIDIKTAVFDQV